MPFSNCDIGIHIVLVEGGYLGQRIYSLCGQVVETFQYPSSPGKGKIRDSEVYFCVTRTNPSEHSRTAKHPVEQGPGQRGATVLLEGPSMAGRLPAGW